LSATWSASSRVGVRIRARTGWRAGEALWLAWQQALDDRQREAGGLAGAGLGRAHHVTALQHHGDGLGLDRGRMDVALFGQGFQDIGREAEIFEADGRAAGAADADVVSDMVYCERCDSAAAAARRLRCMGCMRTGSDCFLC
jgi:hypothetical protein